MNRDWILQTSETRRAFANATWVPLRASQEQARDIMRDTEIGYVGEFFGCGSAAFPPQQREVAERWKEYGAFPEEHEVFAPLRHALETLLQSVDIFDAIYSSFSDTEVI